MDLFVRPLISWFVAGQPPGCGAVIFRIGRIVFCEGRMGVLLVHEALVEIDSLEIEAMFFLADVSVLHL